MDTNGAQSAIDIEKPAVRFPTAGFYVEGGPAPFRVPASYEKEIYEKNSCLLAMVIR